MLNLPLVPDAKMMVEKWRRLIGRTVMVNEIEETTVSLTTNSLY